MKYLHRETPASHGIVQSIAWAVGSGIAIALASRLSKTHRLAVGICSSFVSASIWVALLFFLRADLGQAVEGTVFGRSISVGQYLIGFSLLVLIVGVASSLLAATSRNDDELTSQILAIPSRHWLWLWIPALAWVSMLPIAAYFIWLQFGIVLCSIIHPSLFLRLGTGLFFGFLGIAALFMGIAISLSAVSDPRGSGKSGHKGSPQNRP